MRNSRLRAAFGHRRDGLADGRELGPDGGGGHGVVETDDGQIPGHIQAAPVRDGDDGGRHVVVAGEDRGGWTLAIEQCSAASRPGAISEVALLHVSRIRRDAARFERGLEAREALRARGLVRMSLDESDAGMAERNEMRVISLAARKSSMRTQLTFARKRPVAIAITGMPAADELRCDRRRIRTAAAAG